MDPKLLTEEYILEQRRLRELRKEKIRQQKEALGLIPPPEKESFETTNARSLQTQTWASVHQDHELQYLSTDIDPKRNIPKWENIEMVCEVSDTIRRIETL